MRPKFIEQTITTNHHKTINHRNRTQATQKSVGYPRLLKRNWVPLCAPGPVSFVLGFTLVLWAFGCSAGCAPAGGVWPHGLGNPKCPWTWHCHEMPRTSLKCEVSVNIPAIKIGRPWVAVWCNIWATFKTAGRPILYSVEFIHGKVERDHMQANFLQASRKLMFAEIWHKLKTGQSDLVWTIWKPSPKTCVTPVSRS